MARRWGLGPVFAFEMMTGARRWRVYAGRAVFVGLLLAGLALLWTEFDREYVRPGELARVGQIFFGMVAIVQLSLVLLVAPAATAGAICVDKTRGTLIHTFVTDLSDREIALGKLGARLAPVLAMLSSGVPVLALCAMLGGVDLAAAAGAYLVTIGVAAVGCALALTFSVWARKPHQALLPTYAVLGTWVMAYPAMSVLVGWAPAPPWIWGYPHVAGYLGNPFSAALGITLQPDVMGLHHALLFCIVLVASALSLVSVAAGRVRRVVLGQAARPARREKPGLAARVVSLVPGPPLDGNPILWREWHRKKPGRWTGRFWTVYTVLSALASLFVIVCYYGWPGGRENLVLAAQVNAWEVAIGLLLLSVSAASALAEERDRGSLDVILATPLSSRTILWGKWWGTFAIVPRLAIFPIWVAAALAMVTGQWVGLVLMIGLILAYSAAIVSVGLALATWVPRLSRAVGLSVLAYLGISIGAVLLPSTVRALRPPLFNFGPSDLEGAYLACPYFGILKTTEWSGRLALNTYYAFNSWLATRGPLDQVFWPLVWIGLNLALAILLLAMTSLTFDLCFGRVRERLEFGEEPPLLGPVQEPSSVNHEPVETSA